MKRPAVIVNPDIRALWDAVGELERKQIERFETVCGRIEALENAVQELQARPLATGRPGRAPAVGKAENARDDRR